jgi:putative ATP-dependent endonuclease of OLD family
VAAGEWPPYLAQWTPTADTPLADLRAALASYLGHTKGPGTLADLLYQCSVAEMPAFITSTIWQIKQLVEPPPPVPTGTPAVAS